MKTDALPIVEVSKVIHLRSLPDDVSTQEIVNLAMPFKKHGRIVDFLQLKVSKMENNP